MSDTIELTLIRGDLSQSASVSLRNAVIAGWTGRDRDAVEKHIGELAALGVRRPTTVPTFYCISASRVTTGESIEVLGETSSGEVEFVLLQYAGHLWLGVGSDHTDRAVEAFDVGISKQMCDKPAAKVWWSFDEVASHWETLILRSYVGPERTLYQEGKVSEMLEPAELMSRFAGAAVLPDNTLMFCGTLPALGGVRPSQHFAIELEDPVLRRKILHDYRVRILPAVPWELPNSCR